MNSNKHTSSNIPVSNNLIGETIHRTFLNLQAAYGFAQRGGVKFPYPGEIHSKRLVSEVNLLTSHENRQLVFSESVFSN